MLLVMDYVHITALELSKGGKMFLNFQFNPGSGTGAKKIF